MPHVVCFRNFLGAVRNPKTIKRSSYRGAKKRKLSDLHVRLSCRTGAFGGGGGVQAC